MIEKDRVPALACTHGNQKPRAACIRAFFERLCRSSADYRSILIRGELREVLAQAMRALGMDAWAEPLPQDAGEDFAPADLADELARRILLDARAGQARDDSVEYVERRLRDEFSPRLVYDNAERHKLDIAALVDRLRDAPAAT